MIDPAPAFWLVYGLPAFGIAFACFGVLLIWIAATSFDKKLHSSTVRMRNLQKKNKPAKSKDVSSSRFVQKNELEEISKHVIGRKYSLLHLISGLIFFIKVAIATFLFKIFDHFTFSEISKVENYQVYSIATLYLLQINLERGRKHFIRKVGDKILKQTCMRTFDIIVRTPLKGAVPGDGLLPLRDLDQIRSFLSGTGPSAFFDLPWMPIYVGICFLFHPYIGMAAIAGTAILAGLTFLTDRATKTPTQAATGHGLRRNGLAESGRRNAEVLAAMGMQQRLAARWAVANRDYMEAHRRVTDIVGWTCMGSRLFRATLQFGLLVIGARLSIQGEITIGTAIAGLLLTANALAPAELAIANWKGFVAARQSWRRLSELFAKLPAAEQPHALPAPTQAISVEGVSIAPPGTARIVVQDVTFTLKAGQGVGVIGPSASGKSSLVRAMVGVWPPVRGKVRIDGAALDQWSSDDLGLHVGFLPQDVDLLAGTVAENIARFEPNPPSELVIAAARAAGVHELILRLPKGYDSHIGEGGAGLSAGQRQRIGLARALYRDPFLVVLDEPNANLDSEGENALTQAILGVRQRGGVCVVVAHRPSALAAVDLILMMADGRAQAFGPKDEVLKRVLRPAPTPVQGPGEAAREVGGQNRQESA